MRKHSWSEKDLEVIVQTLNIEPIEGPQYLLLVQSCLQVVLMGDGRGHEMLWTFPHLYFTFRLRKDDCYIILSVCRFTLWVELLMETHIPSEWIKAWRVVLCSLYEVRQWHWTGLWACPLCEPDLVPYRLK